MRRELVSPRPIAGPVTEVPFKKTHCCFPGNWSNSQGKFRIVFVSCSSLLTAPLDFGPEDATCLCTEAGVQGDVMAGLVADGRTGVNGIAPGCGHVGVGLLVGGDKAGRHKVFGTVAGPEFIGSPIGAAVTGSPRDIRRWPVRAEPVDKRAAGSESKSIIGRAVDVVCSPGLIFRKEQRVDRKGVAGRTAAQISRARARAGVVALAELHAVVGKEIVGLVIVEVGVGVGRIAIDVVCPEDIVVEIVGARVGVYARTVVGGRVHDKGVVCHGSQVSGEQVDGPAPIFCPVAVEKIVGYGEIAAQTECPTSHESVIVVEHVAGDVRFGTARMNGPARVLKRNIGIEEVSPYEGVVVVQFDRPALFGTVAAKVVLLCHKIRTGIENGPSVLRGRIARKYAFIEFHVGDVEIHCPAIQSGAVAVRLAGVDNDLVGKTGVKAAPVLGGRVSVEITGIQMAFSRGNVDAAPLCGLVER